MRGLGDSEDDESDLPRLRVEGRALRGGDSDLDLERIGLRTGERLRR